MQAEAERAIQVAIFPRIRERRMPLRRKAGGKKAAAEPDQILAPEQATEQGQPSGEVCRILSSQHRAGLNVESLWEKIDQMHFGNL